MSPWARRKESAARPRNASHAAQTSSPAHRPPGRPDHQGLRAPRREVIAVLRWLLANKIEFVLVGPAAEAVRGAQAAHGPVAIVPAPTARYGRLARALSAAHARLRIDSRAAGEDDTLPVKMTGEKLARGQRWTLRCGVHELDIEGRHPGGPGTRSCSTRPAASSWPRDCPSRSPRRRTSSTTRTSAAPAPPPKSRSRAGWRRKTTPSRAPGCTRLLRGPYQPVYSLR